MEDMVRVIFGVWQGRQNSASRATPESEHQEQPPNRNINILHSTSE